MKKTLLFAFVAAATALTSCQSEVDMFEHAGVATINLNITNDDALVVVSRSAQTADNAVWFAKFADGEYAAASSFTGKTYTPDTYTMTVANYTSEAEAYAANSGAGDAYYTVTRNDVTLVAGTNTVEFNCGTAKNSKVSVDWSGTEGVSGLTVTGVSATQSSKSRSYTYTESGDAFFYAGTSVVCTINYTYNGVEKTIEKTIATPAAATQYALNISANSNGTITTLTINYDDNLAEGESTTATIDAATGDEVAD